MIPGVIGSVIPILPGIPYMFAIALVYAIFDKFQTISANQIIILAIIAVISVVIDYVSGLIGSKYGGASKFAMTIGFAGLVVGIFALPPFGGFIGLFIGILAGEIIKFNDQKKAFKAAFAGVAGSIAGIIANTVLSLIFLTLFIIFAF